MPKERVLEEFKPELVLVRKVVEYVPDKHAMFLKRASKKGKPR